MPAQVADPEDLKLCNCAECDCELLGPTKANSRLVELLKGDGVAVPRLWVAGRVMGRPYCLKCLSRGHRGNTETARPPRQTSRGERDGDGDNPWLDKATRDATEAGH